MSFSKDERVFIVETYCAYKSYKRVREELKLKFPQSAVLNKPTISCLIDKFRDTESVQD